MRFLHSFKKRRYFKGLFCAAAISFIDDPNDAKVQNLWAPTYNNLYTSQTDAILNDLERQSPQGQEFRYYMERDGGWKPRFAQISNNHCIQLVKHRKSGDIVGCACTAIQEIFVKMNMDVDDTNMLTRAVYVGDVRVAVNQRRKGYAKLLADQWDQIAKDKNASLSFCHILSENKASYNLFTQSIGYKPLCCVYYNVIMPSMIKYKYVKNMNKLLDFDGDQSSEWILTDPATKKRIRIVCHDRCNSEKQRIWRKHFSDYQFFADDVEHLSQLGTKVYTATYIDAEGDEDNRDAMSSINTFRSVLTEIVLNAPLKMKVSWILHGLRSGHYSNILQIIKWIILPQLSEKDGGFKIHNLVLFAHVSNDKENDGLLYRVLLEFVAHRAMESEIISMGAVMCERDQDKFGQYYQSGHLENEF